jgi:hypothetical protein
MAISFPTTGLTVGQTYTYGNTTWSWNGYAWDNLGNNIVDPVTTAFLLGNM